MTGGQGDRRQAFPLIALSSVRCQTLQQANVVQRYYRRWLGMRAGRAELQERIEAGADGSATMRGVRLTAAGDVGHRLHDLADTGPAHADQMALPVPTGPVRDNLQVVPTASVASGTIHLHSGQQVSRRRLTETGRRLLSFLDYRPALVYRISTMNEKLLRSRSRPRSLAVHQSGERNGKEHEGDVELARLAKALGHPARVKIMRLLLQRTECLCGEICDYLPLAQSTVSQHLKVLKEAGLIQGEIARPRICYCARRQRLEVLRGLVQALGGSVADVPAVSAGGDGRRGPVCCSPRPGKTRKR